MDNLSFEYPRLALIKNKQVNKNYTKTKNKTATSSQMVVSAPGFPESTLLWIDWMSRATHIAESQSSVQQCFLGVGQHVFLRLGTDWIQATHETSPTNTAFTCNLSPGIRVFLMVEPVSFWKSPQQWFVSQGQCVRYESMSWTFCGQEAGDIVCNG